MPDIFVSKQDKKESKNTHKKSRRPSSDPEELKKTLQKKIQNEVPKPTHKAISAFNYYPNRVKFVGADNKEHIILLLRRHPITNIGWIISVFLMILAPVFLSYVVPIAQLPTDYQLVALMFWYLITLAFAIEKFISWFFNVNIVTDERIFDVDFVHLVYREITDANLDQIQDVTTQVGGVIRTMFNFGNVMIQTAAEIPQIEFVSVPKPDVVAQILRELRVEEEVEKIEGRVR